MTNQNTSITTAAASAKIIVFDKDESEPLTKFEGSIEECVEKMESIVDGLKATHDLKENSFQIKSLFIHDGFKRIYLVATYKGIYTTKTMEQTFQIVE